MTLNARRLVLIGLVAAVAGARGSSAKEKELEIARPLIALTEAEKQAGVEFEKRLKDYLDLHRKVEGTLPNLSKESTPEEIDKNQRALGELIRTERAGAKPGEFFTPTMQGLIRRTMVAISKAPGGKNVKASIMDENPGLPSLKVNDRYPDQIPLSTMPPQVLETLPKLDEDLEYRFIGRRLVLLDAHAHLIIDFTENVLP